MVCLVWLHGLSASQWTKGSQVRFPVGAHAWAAGQVPSGWCMRWNHILMFLYLSFSPCFLLSKNKEIKSLKNKNKLFSHNEKFITQAEITHTSSLCKFPRLGKETAPGKSCFSLTSMWGRVAWMLDACGPSHEYRDTVKMLAELMCLLQEPCITHCGKESK